MSSLTAKKDDLKKAFGITALAVSDQSEKISGHALVKIGSDMAVYATDGDKMAFARLTPIAIDGSFEFTIDPKKMMAVIANTEIENIRIDYNQDSKTVGVYVSDKSDAVLSFPSFNPEEFLSFDSEMNKAIPVGEVDTEIFKTGIRFIQGFLPEEKTPKSEKYTRLYALNGIFYGANGSNKIGAFQSPELSSIDELIIRRIMLSPIISMIERSNVPKALLSTTSSKVFITSTNKSCGFGFLRTNDTIPKYPITLDEPQSYGFNIVRQDFLKKMGRLAITSNKELGIKATIDSSSINLATISERVSKDSLECRPLRDIPESPIEIVFDYRLMKSILNIFQAPNIDIYVDQKKCVLINQAEIEIIASKERKPFRAVAFMCLARAL